MANITKRFSPKEILKSSDLNEIVEATNENTDKVTQIGHEVGELGNLETTEKTNLVGAINEVKNQGGGGYQPPVGGIPKSDLSSGVQQSLNKADTALQAHQSLAEYALKSEVYSKDESDGRYQSQGRYLTEHQDVSHLATKTEMQSGIAFAQQSALAAKDSAEKAESEAAKAKGSAERAESTLDVLRGIVGSPDPDAALASQVAENTVTSNYTKEELLEKKICFSTSIDLNYTKNKVGENNDSEKCKIVTYANAYNFPQNDIVRLDGYLTGITLGKYHLFVEIEVVPTFSVDATSFKMIVGSYKTGCQQVTSLTHVVSPIGQRAKLWLGEWDILNSNPILWALRANGFCDENGNLKKNSTAGNVAFKYYGAYIVKSSDLEGVEDFDRLAKQIDFSASESFYFSKNWKEGVNEALTILTEESVKHGKEILDTSEKVQPLIEREMNVSSLIDFSQGNLQKNEGELEYKDGYTKIYKQANNQQVSQLRCIVPFSALPDGDYVAFIKCKLTCPLEADYFTVGIVERDGGFETRLRTNKMQYIEMDYKAGSVYRFVVARNVGYIDESMPLLTGEVSFEFYGAYVVKKDDFITETRKGIAYALDYSKTQTILTRTSIYSAIAGFANIAETTPHADFAEKATLASDLNTSLRGKMFSGVGDSLLSYSRIDGLFRKLGLLKVGNNGQGGGRVGNNTAGSKYGFCTIERLVLMPKNSKIILVYGGANDGPAKWVSGKEVLVEELLGSIADAPLSITDMMNYRVTDANKDIINTPGRTRTFYQAYKTMLRNIQALYPKAQVFCVTQHPYYYRTNETDGKWVRRGYAEAVVKAIRAVAEEFGFPIIDLWSTSGLNDYNVGQKLIMDEGIAVHPRREFGLKVGNLLFNGIMQYCDKYDTGTDEDDSNALLSDCVVEMRQWVIDVRSETDDNKMTLLEAIEAFANETITRGVELKNNMLLVYYSKDGTDINAPFCSRSYFLINKDDIHNPNSWERWSMDTINDPNEHGGNINS